MNNLAVVGTKALLSEEDVQVLKDSMFRGFSEPEIKFSLAVANQLQLSPLLRQVHFVKRFDSKLKRDVITPQTGIDGFRLIADRTHRYAGSDEPVFEYAAEDTSKKKPIKASVTVWKFMGQERFSFTASARWDEFYPGDAIGFMWKQKPHVMLGKCAEAQALRKAFPAELSSVYADEELEQADAGEKKAQNIQEKILNAEPVTSAVVIPDPEPTTNEMPPFDEFENEPPRASAFSTYEVSVGGTYKGKKFGELNPKELREYISNVKAWFAKEGKPLHGGWKELYENGESYLKDIGA